MEIRQEIEKDYGEVYKLVKEAFETAEHALWCWAVRNIIPDSAIFLQNNWESRFLKEFPLLILWR